MAQDNQEPQPVPEQRDIDLTKGSRGADVFPAADPVALQAMMASPGPLMPEPPSTPQASAPEPPPVTESD